MTHPLSACTHGKPQNNFNFTTNLQVSSHLLHVVASSHLGYLRCWLVRLGCCCCCSRLHLLAHAHHVQDAPRNRNAFAGSAGAGGAGRRASTVRPFYGTVHRSSGQRHRTWPAERTWPPFAPQSMFTLERDLHTHHAGYHYADITTQTPTTTGWLCDSFSGCVTLSLRRVPSNLY